MESMVKFNGSKVPKQSSIDFQKIISLVLKYGVWLSLSVSTFGGILYILQQADLVKNYSSFAGNHETFTSIVDSIITGVSTGQGQSIILLGIILLFLTPITRILLSLFVFIFEKDYLYATITTIVILIIAVSVILGFAH
ncbi:DUF1634 domain-containing protein [Flavobacterium sp. 7A]|uniref:DUF1634 domain-containing protein n=1 Tax=Flavobacterium sp. 7A TaxID=2940571 RepID=UPI0022265972|nr:DUF1634 domain-containing protein [Flavobacterium sp. 7A]MCW2118435.1 putative membrane protein [Flavobacterium sp. 7A]